MPLDSSSQTTLQVKEPHAMQLHMHKIFSGLVSLFPVNSTTYSTISLIVAGVAVTLAVVYLMTTSPASFQSQSQFRGFRGITIDCKKKLIKNIKLYFPGIAQNMDLDILGLVSSALKVYSALNEEDDE